MKVYVFINNDEQFICKKAGKVYISDKDVDKMLTYRNIKHAENVARDHHYWDYREIGIKEFNITEIDLKFEITK